MNEDRELSIKEESELYASWSKATYDKLAQKNLKNRALYRSWRKEMKTYGKDIEFVLDALWIDMGLALPEKLFWFPLKTKDGKSLALYLKNWRYYLVILVKVIHALFAIVLVVAILPLPFGFYDALRWFVFVMGLLSLIFYYLAHHSDRGVLLMAFLLLVVVFNPIEKMYMEAQTWKFIDLVGGCIFAYSAYNIEKVSI